MCQCAVLQPIDQLLQLQGLKDSIYSDDLSKTNTDKHKQIELIQSLIRVQSHPFVQTNHYKCQVQVGWTVTGETGGSIFFTFNSVTTTTIATTITIVTTNCNNYHYHNQLSQLPSFSQLPLPLYLHDQKTIPPHKQSASIIGIWHCIQPPFTDAIIV